MRVLEYKGCEAGMCSFLEAVQRAHRQRYKRDGTKIGDV